MFLEGLLRHVYQLGSHLGILRLWPGVGVRGASGRILTPTAADTPFQAHNVQVTYTRPEVSHIHSRKPNAYTSC